MTIEELYGKVIADDELKAALAEAMENGKTAEWVAAQGVEATEEELLSYAKAATAGSERLSLDQLDSVAGGYDYSTFIGSMAEGMTGGSTPCV